jgi:hypothetical protein
VDRVREWAALIGRRDIAHVVFVSLLVPFGMLMEAGVSKVLMLVARSWRDNVVGRGVADLLHSQSGLAIGSIVRGRSAMKPLIACPLPIVCIVLLLLRRSRSVDSSPPDKS